MTSNNTLMPQPFQKNVNLKVLYTFDDKNIFLARSNSPILAQIITLPNQHPHNGIEIGCINLKDCLDLLLSISPEWFQKGMDYSIYYKDIIEYGEPYVGSGLYSKIQNDNNSKNTLITGRLSTNLINLFQGSNSPTDTLDIKLRLSPIHSVSRTSSSSNNNNINNINNNCDNILQNKRKQDDSYSLYEDNISNSLSEQQHHHQHQQQQRKKMRKSSITKIPSNNANNNITTSNNIIINNLKNNAPQLASRTQSLPFITEDSLAHRIRISDMITSKVEEEIDASGEPISSRFSNFPKNNDNDDEPTKARKTKSFIQSVVKIGDNAVSSKNKKTPSLASVFEHSSKKCVNCMSISTPPYKFHKDGIFHCGNSGYLCSICNFYQSKNDLKSLRDRGEMGSRGLLDDPYKNKISLNSSSNILPHSKKMKKKKSTNISNPNSSILENSSSSPIFSSPMNLQNGFTVKSKKQINSNLSNNTISRSSNKNNTSNKNKITNNNNNNYNNKQTYETIHEVENFRNEDLMALLKLESTFANYKSTPNIHINQSTELDPIEDMFRIPDHKFVTSGNNSSGSSLKGQQSKNNTPDENNEEYYRDFDNIPLDATKLNTTLIPLDDDDKENYPPSNMPPPNINIYHSNKISNKESKEIINNEKDNHIHNLFGTNDFSPSIQRIIESFSNEPSSPTKGTTNEWNYNFFEEDNSENDTSGGSGDGDINTSSASNGLINQHTECDDPEIERILSRANLNVDNSTNNNNDDIPNNITTTIAPGTSAVHGINLNNIEKYEITPRDPGTSQTQQNGESPNGLKMTPGNSAAFDIQISSSGESKLINNNNNNNNNNNDNSNNKSTTNVNINNDTNVNTINKGIDGENKKESSSKDKKTRLTMPSSPFFHIHNEGELTKDDKTLDTTESLINWDAKSSPVTEPLSSSYSKQ